MAAPTFESAGAIVSDLTGAASTTPTPPAHVADDILIAVANNDANATMSTATAGWNLIDISQQPCTFLWKRATGAGTAGPTITAASTDQFAICYVIRGCITTGTPYEDATPNNTTSTTPATSAIDTLGDERLIVSFLGVNDDTAFSSGYPPSGSGWADGSQTTTTDGTDCGFYVITKTKASAGNEAQVSFGTLGASERWQSMTLAFIPPVALVGDSPKKQAFNYQPFLAQ